MSAPTTSRPSSLPTAMSDAITAVQPAAAVITLDGRARLMLTVAEVAGLLEVNRKRVMAWIENGDLPVLNLAPGSRNGQYRIAVSAVLDLIARRDEPVPPR